MWTSPLHESLKGHDFSARGERGCRPGRTSGLLRDELTPYNEEQRNAFVAAYNSALENYAGDLERALEIAHAAARGTPGER